MFSEYLTATARNPAPLTTTTTMLMGLLLLLVPQNVAARGSRWELIQFKVFMLSPKAWYRETGTGTGLSSSLAW